MRIGNVELAEAKELLKRRAFIKGNIDGEYPFKG